MGRGEQILTFSAPQTAEKIMAAIQLAVEQISTFSIPQILEKIMAAIQLAVEQVFDVLRATDDGETHGRDPHRCGADFDGCHEETVLHWFFIE